MIEIAHTSSDLLSRMVAGLIGAGIVSTLAVRLKWLSLSGAIVSTVIGTAAAGAGWDFAAVLLGFFASATLVSRYRAQAKSERLSRIIAKGNERDAFQVLANGSVFAAAAVWMIVRPGAPAMFAGVAALAGACADTWATEIGSLSLSAPRSILGWKQVPTGTSGGVTMLGIAAAALGAGVVGLIALCAGMPAGIFAACFVAGTAGAAVDSLVGASLQSRRWCARCQEFTERETHICGSPTTAAKGLAWLDNDMVNFICTFVAALIGALWVL